MSEHQYSGVGAYSHLDLYLEFDQAIQMLGCTLI